MVNLNEVLVIIWKKIYLFNERKTKKKLLTYHLDDDFKKIFTQDFYSDHYMFGVRIFNNYFFPHVHLQC